MTNAYAQGFGPIVSDSELLCYVSQTARGQMLMGAEFDSQPISHGIVVRVPPERQRRVTHILPFLRDLRVLRHGPGSATSRRTTRRSWVDRGRRPVGHHRLGDVGFKAIPAGGEAMAELIATGAMPSLFVLRAGPIRPRPRHGRSGIGGDALMLWLTCPTCGERPVTEFRFGGELPRAGPPDR